MSEAQEGEIWICESGTFSSSHIVCRVAAKPTAKMVMLQPWERGWRDEPAGWRHASRRDKSCLKFRLPDDADPPRIIQLIASAAAERQDRKKRADAAYLDRLAKLSA